MEIATVNINEIILNNDLSKLNHYNINNFTKSLIDSNLLLKQFDMVVLGALSSKLGYPETNFDFSILKQELNDDFEDSFKSNFAEIINSLINIEFKIIFDNLSNHFKPDENKNYIYYKTVLQIIQQEKKAYNINYYCNDVSFLINLYLHYNNYLNWHNGNYSKEYSKKIFTTFMQSNEYLK
jgi:hypothetical protein